MTAGEAEQRVLALLTIHAKGAPVFGGETRIMADTNLDSVAVMDFVLELEDEFDISIPLNRLAGTTTVRELIEVVQEISAEA